MKFTETKIILVDKYTGSSEYINLNNQQVDEINKALSKYGFKLALSITSMGLL